MELRWFNILTDFELDIEPPKPYKEPVATSNREFLLPTAKDVTLAEYSTVSMGAITAHRIADYRRRHFSLVLLPEVHTLLDDLINTKEVENVSVLMQSLNGLR